MKAEELVCTLEQAKRLEEIGEIRLNSLYKWYEGVDKESQEDVEPFVFLDGCIKKGFIYTKSYPAYNFAELGRLIPGKLFTKHGWSFLHQYKIDPDNERNTGFALIYKSNDDPNHTVPPEPVIGKTEAEARANMLLYLLEKHGICPSIINEVR